MRFDVLASYLCVFIVTSSQKQAKQTRQLTSDVTKDSPFPTSQLLLYGAIQVLHVWYVRFFSLIGNITVNVKLAVRHLDPLFPLNAHSNATKKNWRTFSAPPPPLKIKIMY